MANTLMGKTTASATDAAASLGLDAFKQALLRQTAEWAARLFGDAAVNATLARIINEQVRPQLGRDWGEPEAPNCTGLRVNHRTQMTFLVPASPGWGT